MEKVNYCRVELYKGMEVGSRDLMCFVCEFDSDEDFKKVAPNFFEGLIFKEFSDLKCKFNHLLGWNADYYTSLIPPTATLILLSECAFVYISEDFHFKGRVEEENLKQLGFKSLLDFDENEKKYKYKLLFSVDSSPNEVYVRTLLYKK